MAQAKIPPHSIEAEQSVLGAIMIDKNGIVEVAGFLRPEHFYDDRHGTIYSVMLSLYEERKPIDLLTLSERLKTTKQFKDIGGAAYLTELTGMVPTAAHIENYGQMVRELHAKRELIRASALMAEMAFDDRQKLEDILDDAEGRVFTISQANISRNVIPLKETLAQMFDQLDEIQKRGGGVSGVTSGFRDLDNALAGFQDSNLIILAARPGVGKTTILLDFCRHAAIKERQPICYFSLEMSVEELRNRLVVSQSGIDAWKLKTGRLDEEDYDRIQEAMGVMADAPFYIDDTPGISLMEIRTKARRLQMEHGLKLIVVDYLQLVNPGRSFESRVQEVSLVSQALKNLARELKIPVIAASQLNRQVESRGSKKPQLADLRESGSIEQDADVVMFLYRPDENKDMAPSDKIPTVLSIDKHRNGALTEINLMLHGSKQQFKLVAKQAPDAEAA